MDANGQKPYLVARDEDWARPGTPPPVAYDRARGVLKLASRRRAPGWVEKQADALVRVEETPGAADRFGTRARWNAATGEVLATGAFPDEVPIYTAAPGEIVSDIVLGFDDVAYLGVAGRLALRDLRGRFGTVEIDLPTNRRVWRLAARPEGGAYFIDRISHTLGRVHGLPMRERTGASYAPGTFRPSPEDPEPALAVMVPTASWPIDEQEVAIACSRDGRLALLTWVSGGAARLRVLGDDDRFSAPTTLTGVRYPYSLAWVGGDRVAVLIARDRSPGSADPGGTAEAAVFPVDVGAAVVDPVGDLYPLRDHTGAAFLHGTGDPPEYPTTTGTRPLHKISWPSFAAEGTAGNQRRIDSENAHTVWHRLYLEANIPPGCGVRVRLATTETSAPPADGDPDVAWHEHRFGSVPGEPGIDVPRGVWMAQASEIPFHDGLLPCERKPHQSGLWTALVQRPGYRVRTLTGRYLWIRLELHGDGRTTPEVAALRVYGGRQSYVQKYLPELYREQVFGLDADARSTPGERVASTRADFLDRFIGNFEGILTPLEDRIKDAWLLTDPTAAPEQALDWLGSWIGFSFAPALPTERRRAMLSGAMELYRRRGTLRGLALALDLATGGAVERGEIVVFEDFRLRRTFATILGANLAPTENPLIPGLAVSGNSFVGDTLFLGDENNQEFLALYHADLVDAEKEPNAAAAIAAIFDRLAHRATVLVHSELVEQDLGLIRQIVDREAPAHVAVQVLTASQRFLVGMSSLVGIDTFLGKKPAPGVVRVDVSTIGRRDLIQRSPSLDPRLGDSPAPPPVARAGAPGTSEVGDELELDASESTAAPGRRITRFHWTLKE